MRYPGGKAKLSDKIINKIANYIKDGVQYREPFFGGGSVGLKLLTTHPITNVWINDKDIGIACLWQSVIRYPDLLMHRINEFIPSVELFYQFKKELLGISEMSDDVVDIGFKKLAIHQISYSGLGTKSGGPLGGESQKSQYKIDCRWSPKYICKKIEKLTAQLNKLNLTCTNNDFSTLIEDDSCECVIYLDPPYFVKGNDLYQHGFTIKDHERLANALKQTSHPWVLSYDDCWEIRRLYDWAIVEDLTATYTITSTKNKITGDRQSLKKGELLICPK